MTPPQGWDIAEFYCGRCGHRIVAAHLGEYGRAVAQHRATHQTPAPAPAAVRTTTQESPRT